ncbi:MAG: hypothetical protein HOO00_03755 [Rhodospirillaceae bacterium]|jgi:hypothetical protein|nr:hypothetical protein [Rhodospirillaceae bacterium]MBT5375137.1 hypothetical protein [Rhodospirillaceae bacterium]MBT5659483.1 hypothetical protein [Rhodospirillaceae bacterium]MBT5751598.1 hypothetical protein [Rhodospirillaceae bacterium]
MARQADQKEGDASLPREERRTTALALSLWIEKWEKGHLPSPDDFLPNPHSPELYDHFFIAELGREINQSTFTCAGRIPATLAGSDPTGKTISDCFPPSLWDSLSYSVTTAAVTRKPTPASGYFITNDKHDALHRSLIMPLSRNSVNIDFVLGAVNFKPL